MKYDSKLIVCLLLVLFISVLLLGCQQAQKPTPKEKNDYGLTNERRDDIEKEEDIQGDQVTERSMAVKSLIQKNERIADSLVDIPGIDNASVLVTDGTAVVAILLDEGNEFNSDIANQIESTVKRNDDDIETIVMTTDEDTFYRVDDIEQEFMRGDSMDDYIKKVNNIIKSISE